MKTPKKLSGLKHFFLIHFLNELSKFLCKVGGSILLGLFFLCDILLKILFLLMNLCTYKKRFESFEKRRPGPAITKKLFISAALVVK